MIVFGIAFGKIIFIYNFKPNILPVFICKFSSLMNLTHISLASFLWDIGKQYSPRCDAAERGVPSGAILFAWRNFIEKWDKI